ncbi:MAG TPA: xanthine dehydrogenase family protein subunit M [Candidatus Dormibacteraeota bacterium]|jgi:carbon-monoxide dehydrogenase medium subunit
MFPAAFDYIAPSALDEVLSLLSRHGDDAKVLAGGQSLIPLLKLRFAAPTILIDIGRVDGLEGIRRENGHVRIGARTRHRDVESATDLRGTLDVLLDAAPLISDPLIRNMGTVGGSICHADPAGDWGAVMLAVGAEFVVRSSAGERVLPATGFFQGPFTTGLRADEVMTEIRVPVTRGRSGGTYLKLERKVGDFASVAAAVHLVLGDDGRVAAAGIGLCAVAAQSTKATAAEAALVGQTPSDDMIAEAARLAAGAAEPKADIRGSADYKRDVARVFVQRGLHTAVARAQGAAA